MIRIGPDQLRIKEGGGCLSFFGLPFFAAGVFLLLMAVGIVPVENAEEIPTLAQGLIFLMGLVFGGVGGVLTFGRRWTTLDRGRGFARKEWGLLVPMKEEIFGLEEYEAVVLRLETGGSDSADRYEVSLRGSGGRPSLDLTSTTQYGESREQAAEVAEFLGLPLVDRSSGHEARYAPDEVHKSFRERADAGVDLPESVTRPRDMVCTIRIAGSGVEIQRPGPPFKFSKLLPVAVPVGLLAYFGRDLIRFFQETGTPEAVVWAMLGFVGFFVVGLPSFSVLLSLARSLRGGTLITANPEGLVVEERGAVTRRVTRIAASEILGLDSVTTGEMVTRAQAAMRGRQGRDGRALPPGRRGGREPGWVSLLRRLAPSKGIIVKTKDELVTLGAGLPDDEIHYLHGVLARALAGEE